MSCRTGSCRKFLLTLSLLTLAAALTAVPPVAFAQNINVDNPQGVFQMEGDAQDTASICFLPPSLGGPAIATPGSYPVAGGGTSTCPTVNPSANPATWSLINYAGATDDWSSFGFTSSPSPHFTSKSNALFVPAFVQDPRNTGSDNAFLGTSSKDIDDLDELTWNPHGVQDKDDIEHAMAAAYDFNGHTVIYAAMDRFANSGDSTAGFWFVQDSTFAMCVGPGQAASPSGPVANPACTAAGAFVGNHFIGDLLIVSDFSIGGAVSTINIFEWNGAGITLVETLSPAPCDLVNQPVSPNPARKLCGLVNNQFTQVLATKGANKGNPILNPVNTGTGGWSFTDKGGASSYVTGEFLEIAVDLNAIFQGNVPCFSNFYAETRSSTSDTASLSDVTIPVSFPLCSISATKTCTGSTIVQGNKIQYNFSGTVDNTGAQTVYGATVHDTPPSPSGVTISNLTVSAVSPSTIPSGSSGTYTGSFVSTAILGANDKNLMSAAASSDSSGTPLNVVCGANPPTSSDNCADWGDPTAGSCPPTITTGLTVTKICQTCLEGNSNVHIKVGEAFKVCNTSNVNLTSVSVQDCKGTISGSPGSQTCSTGSFTSIASGVTLNAATDATHPTCADYFTTYTPTTPAASYSDQVIASGTAAISNATVYANNGTPLNASCDVCPVNLTCPTSSTLKAPCPNGLVCPP